jgi:polyisoprenoid-binding protein YceI
MSVDTEVTGRTEDLPAPGTWIIDPHHSSVSFSARHLGLSKVRGSFGEFSGTLEVGEEPTDSGVSVQIHTHSVYTGTPTRDDHLRSPDFLDVENFPTMDFVSRGVERSGDGYTLTGDLTIRGTTRPVTLDVEFEGLAPDPMSGGQRVAFSAETSINRDDFGLTWNAPLETGQILVGKKVNIELEVVATSKPMESPEEVQEEAASPESGLA